MFKTYLSDAYIDTTHLTEHLDLPPDKILNIGTKILLDTDSDEKVVTVLSSLKLDDIDISNESERS